MSYRKSSRFGKGTLLVAMIIVGLLAPLSISVMDKNRPEREIYAEGFITEKNIEKGFGSAYIFVLNGTTDISVYKWQYNSFSVGDYIEVYIVLFGYEIIKVN